MKYGHVKYVDKPVSRIVFGTATPIMFAAFRSVYGESGDFRERLDKAFTLLDGMYSQGVNCFDCSDHYGEEPLGEWIESRGLHEKVVILTKGAHHNRWRKRVTDFDILHDAHNSLAKLKTDKLDIYMLHRDDPDVSTGPIIDVLNRLLDEGKIGAFGASNWTVERFDEANEYAAKHNLRPFTVCSPNFGLADQLADPWGGGCVTVSGPENKQAREYYSQRHMPIFAYSSLARGLFSGLIKSDCPEKAREALDEAGMKGYFYPENIERLRRCEILSAEKGATVAQIAMAWLFNQRNLDVYALVATSRPENMRLNIEASEIVLTDAECRWLDLEGEKP